MAKIRFLFILLIACMFTADSFAQGKISVSRWRMYEGDVITLNKKSSVNGDPAAYAQMQVPVTGHASWKPAEYGQDGEVLFKRKSKITACREQIQPTYFEAKVNIPPGTKINKFNVSYIKADDGARIYIFNAKNPNGAFDPKADLKLKEVNTGAVDLSRFVTEGENRVVIAQFDDCPVENNVHGIDIAVNGEEVTPKVLPSKFQLHAYSINGKRVEKGSDYWMGFSNNDNIGKILSAKNGSVMTIEKVEDAARGTIAFKVNNSSNMYLTVADDLSVKLAPLDAKSNKHLFIVRHPEEQSAANLNYISFESASQPGAYLRHQGFVLKVHRPSDHQRKNDIVYRQDASWLFEPVK